MASVLSQSASPSLTGISTIPSKPRAVCVFNFWSNPAFKRDESRGYTEEPTQAQIPFNRLAAETVHRESTHSLGNADFKLTRQLPNFLVDTEVKDVRRQDLSNLMDTSYSGEEDQPASQDWKNIQDYGQYLGQAASHFPLSPAGPVYPPPISVHTIPPPDGPTPQTSNSNQLSAFEWISWRQFEFNTEFSHLAPLNASQDRIYAQQSGNLANWVANPANDQMFSGWQSLNQVVDPPPISEEAQHQQEQQQAYALQQILTVQESDRLHQMSELGCRPESRFHGDQPQGPFAQYLSQQAPASSSQMQTQESGVTSNIEQSRSGSSGISDEDTRSVVSQDNHWRRTIFG